MKLSIITLLALLAFAANSVLCRLALKGSEADAFSFTALRLVSGAVVLAAIVLIHRGRIVLQARQKQQWLAPLMLFIYALGFSLAYMQLSTGTGALVLFGTVQVTLVAINLLRGQAMSVWEWGGIALAFFGLVYLVLPGASAPPLSGFLLMVLAGIAWGSYTFLGRGSKTATEDTAQNFILSLPFMMLAGAALWLAGQVELSINIRGVWLAVLSGALASGCGYALWYTALPKLSTTEAAVLQLLVPIIAALGGVVFVAEAIDTRLIIASAITLSGIGAVIGARRFNTKVA